MIKKFVLVSMLFLLMAMPALAASPKVKKQARDGDTAVDFGMMTVDFTASNTAGVYSLGLSYPVFSLDWSESSGFSGEIHVCDTPNAGGASDLSASSQCDLVATLGSADSSVGSFSSKKRYILVEIATAGTGYLTIKGSWDQISSESTVDRDGNGLYEYVLFPQDFDGDGSSWHTCDCGGGSSPAWWPTTDWICGTHAESTTNLTQRDYSDDDGDNQPTACKHEGQSVYVDAMDDFNSLNGTDQMPGKLETGAIVEFEKGTYVLKGRAASNTSGPYYCWDSASNSFPSSDDPDLFNNGRCQQKDGTWLTDLHVDVSGVTITGQGVDPNGFSQDLIIDGTHIVNENGNIDDWQDAGNAASTIANARIVVGHPAVTTNNSFNIIDNTRKSDCVDANGDELCDSDGTRVYLVENTEEAWHWCVDTTNRTAGGAALSSSVIPDGSLVSLTTPSTKVGLGRTWYRVKEVTSTACSFGTGTGVEVVVAGTPYLNDLGGTGTMSDDAAYSRYAYEVYGDVGPYEIRGSGYSALPSTSYFTGVIVEDRLTSNITIKNLWVSHVDYPGTGGCVGDPTVFEVSGCDQGAIFKITSGFNHTLSDFGVLETGGFVGSGNIIDADQYTTRVTVENGLFRYNFGSGLVELGNNWVLRDSTFLDNSGVVYDQNGTSPAGAFYFVRQQAFSYEILNNIFERNFIVGNQVSAIVELLGEYGTFSGNKMTHSPSSCLNIKPGARHLNIKDNLLDCGASVFWSNVTNGDNGFGSRYVMGVPILIDLSEGVNTEFINIENNKFLGSGNITRYIDSEVPEEAGYAILIRENQSSDEDYDIGIGGINIKNNYFQLPTDRSENVDEDASSFAVGVGGGNSNKNDRIYFDRNILTQGEIATQYAIGLRADQQELSVLDSDDDGVGLITCGVNWIGGKAYTSYSWDKPSREYPTQCMSNGSYMPELVWPTMAATDAPDCSSANVPHGTVVTIVDDTGAGNCAETSGQLDGGGSTLSTCKCGSAGSWVSF